MIWKRAVFALFAVAAGTNVPTPLLLVYQERLGLSAEVLTALFGCYAAGLVPARRPPRSSYAACRPFPLPPGPRDTPSYPRAAISVPATAAPQSSPIR